MPNGMKSGSGDDPFADADSGGDESETSEAGSDTDASDTETTTPSLPWIYARENAKSQREMVQFFLRRETQTQEDEAQRELETILGEEPLVFDVREAAYQVALEEHLDDVAAKLREWGYDAE